MNQFAWFRGKWLPLPTFVFELHMSLSYDGIYVTVFPYFTRVLNSAAMQNFFVKSREYIKSRVPNFCRNFTSIGNMTRLIIALCLIGLNKLPIFSCPSVRTLIKNKFICDVTSLLSIPCPRISSIHILLDNSIFIITSGFKRCSFRSMKNFWEFYFDTPL